MIEEVQASLGFEPLSEDSWRLVDLAVGENDPARVIAYIEQMPAGFVEAVWVQSGAAVSRHPSRDDVLQEALLLRGRRPGISAHTKPLWIPHRPPPATRSGSGTHTGRREQRGA